MDIMKVDFGEGFTLAAGIAFGSGHWIFAIVLLAVRMIVR